jgi:hypothetical protein
MPKYRVTYVAVKRQLYYRPSRSLDTDGKPLAELLDSQTPFRKEGTTLVDAADEQAAMKQVRLTLPADCEFTAQVSKQDGRLPL